MPPFTVSRTNRVGTRGALERLRKEDSQMRIVREWGFPVALIAAWAVAAAYTVSLLIKPPGQETPRDLSEPVVVADTNAPAS
jgi:hypothetical protein